MKTKKLLAFVPFMILLLGCISIPGTYKVFKLLNTDKAPVVYIINKWTVQDELTALQMAMNQTTDENLRSLIGKQYALVSGYLNYLTGEDNVAFKPIPLGPPPPPPPPIIPSVKYIVFFTRSAPDKVELYKNGELVSVLKKGKFLELTNTYITLVPRGLHLNNGDSLTLKYKVRYLNKDGEVLIQEINYTETNEKTVMQR